MLRIFEPKITADEGLCLYGRNNILNKIKDYIVDNDIPENVAILGVKGIGKTSVIKTAFCKSRNESYYKNAGVLVTFVSIPDTNQTMKGFYSYLNTAILNALDMIEDYDKTRYDALSLKIFSNIDKIKNRSIEIDDATLEAVLNKTIEIIKSDGLKLLLVFDDFERFADSSSIKKAQYKFMRDMANSKKISLFISTGQDLTKVSEEIVGSGFENIFKYEELRGIRGQDIEKWMTDVRSDTDFEFDDLLIDWIEEISGGIPIIVGEAATVAYRFFLKNKVFDKTECSSQLYSDIIPLMKRWWLYTDEVEHCIFENLIKNKNEDSVHRDCLIKKGYLIETDNGKIVYTTPLFKKFITENVFLKETKSSSREDFYKNYNADFNDKQQLEAFFEYLLDRLTEAKTINQFIRPVDKEICKVWNINCTFWDTFSPIRKSDCTNAYRFDNIMIDAQLFDYTPVTTLLGNFLEGLLNDCLLEPLKKYMPYVKIKVSGGRKVCISDSNNELTIGAFEYIFRNEDVFSAISVLSKAKELGIDAQRILNFSSMLTECHKIRNKSDHPGEQISLEEKNLFINYLFKDKNSMLNFLSQFVLLV